MKTPIAITLIIMGTLLVMTPVLSDYLYQRNVVELLTKSQVGSVSLVGQMTENYRFGCWLTGSCMVAVAVLASRRSRMEATEPAGNPSTARV
ncbi:MAG: hypothetical protein EOP86_04305 [Verrucomicrobiaceae bacterium]|nr:MAG: hypothetical protein EOP86_04305 [Verrucomicrobiaceae bacterium]